MDHCLAMIIIPHLLKIEAAAIGQNAGLQDCYKLTRVLPLTPPDKCLSKPKFKF